MGMCQSYEVLEEHGYNYGSKVKDTYISAQMFVGGSLGLYEEVGMQEPKHQKHVAIGFVGRKAKLIFHCVVLSL